ncbi:hypothetical protein M422DRAFT_245574 [Sphaerobolus stellatus SS14]|nr:hypothetical protein M422DRAFT_245574 [Sphaerobolus stellatus SS14]
MTDLVLPSHMLAWKTSGKVERMEDVPAGDARRTVQGFQADEKFDWPAPTFSFDDPNEEEDHLSKVACYWKAHDQERTQRESRFCELLDAEEAAVMQSNST